MPKKQIIICPHCKEELVVRMQAPEVIAVYSPSEEKEGGDKKDWKSGLTQEQIGVVELAKNAGIFDAFVEVAKVAKENNMPQCLERFFITVIKTATPRTMPFFAVKAYKKEFQADQINFSVAQQIGVIVVDHVIRAFIPTDKITGRVMRNMQGKVKGKIRVAESVFHDWRRTRHGYVSGRGAMFEILRQKSIGRMGGDT